MFWTNIKICDFVLIKIRGKKHVQTFRTCSNLYDPKTVHVIT